MVGFRENFSENGLFFRRKKGPKYLTEFCTYNWSLAKRFGRISTGVLFFSEKIIAGPTVGLSLSVTALVRYAREQFLFARRGLDKNLEDWQNNYFGEDFTK